MKKIMTLKQSWIACLTMWRFVSENYVSDKVRDVNSLKRIWLRNNKSWLKEQGIRLRVKHDCFFCQYNDEKDGDAEYDETYWARVSSGEFAEIEKLCTQCPGKLISKRFQCESYSTYHWQLSPKKFYKKIVELHERFLKAQEEDNEKN